MRPVTMSELLVGRYGASFGHTFTPCRVSCRPVPGSWNMPEHARTTTTTTATTMTTAAAATTTTIF